MADEFDKASEIEQEMLAHALSQTLNAPVQKLHPKGTCYNCLEEIEKPKLFCDAECAEDYEKYSNKGR